MHAKHCGKKQTTVCHGRCGKKCQIQSSLCSDDHNKCDRIPYTKFQLHASLYQHRYALPILTHRRHRSVICTCMYLTVRYVSFQSPLLISCIPSLIPQSALPEDHLSRKILHRPAAIWLQFWYQNCSRYCAVNA